MRRWLEGRMGRLTGLQSVVLVAVGLGAATLVSDVTNADGPLGPAGVFFALVLVVGALGGTLAGVVTIACSALVIGVAFTGDRGSLALRNTHDAADLIAFVVISGLLTAILARLTQARQATQDALGQLDAMVRHAPVGIGFVEPDLRIVELNDSLAAMNRRTVADLIGLGVDEVPELVANAVPDLIRDVLQRGVSKLDVAYRDGDLHASAGYYPVRGADGSITGVGVVVREVSAELQRDLLFARVTRLQELTASLAVTGTVEEVVTTAVRSIQLAVGARAASFCRVDGDVVRVDGSIGYDDDVIEHFRQFPLDRDVPIAEAIRTGTPILCRTRAEALERFPHLEASITLGSSQAIAALPLRGGASVLGAIGISFHEERSFDADEAAFLVAATTQCATAFERASAFESERKARRAAEAANRRLEYLSEATVVLSQSLDPETTMQRLAELAVPTLGDWCAVHVVDGDFAYPVALANENAEATAMVRDLSNRHPVPISAPAGLGAVVRTGEPIVLPRVTMEAVRAGSDEGEVVDLLSRLKSIAIVPMSFQGEVIGTVTLSNTTDRDLDDTVVSLARELAARAAQAITNARLYQERNRVASTLQASLLPPSTIIVPGIDVATRFVPSAEGLDVGGDFFDVFRLGTVDHPADTWAFVIGDVRGKGADAAAITGIARATIRAVALDETSPAAMLQRLNQVLLAAAEDDQSASETGEPRFCTACVITATPCAEGAELVVAAGGHPLPYVIRAGGEIAQVGVHGGLIGAIGTPTITDVAVSMGAGDALVLYTDGVTERHEGRVFFDEEGLADVLDGCIGATAYEIAERVDAAARAFVESKPRDDLAIVVARIPDPAPPGTIGRRRLPHDKRAAAVARRFVSATLREHGADAIVDVAKLLTSELVTNALVHGAPSVHVDVLATDAGYRIAITDEDPGTPEVRVAQRDDDHGRGLLLVERLAERWGVDARPPGKSVWFELPLLGPK